MNNHTTRTMLHALRLALSDFGPDFKGPTIDAIRDAILTGENDAALTKRDEENAAKLQEIGKNAFESIAEMVAALECDYDRLEELREATKELPHGYALDAVVAGYIWTHAESDTGSDRYESEADATCAAWKHAYPESAEELAALESAAGDCESRDDAEQRIHEDPLSVEVRGEWHTPGASRNGALDEFRILLGTGGPAVRIIGELDQYGQPSKATLQTQDWFLPWTDCRDADEETLLTYCRCFYFGEG